MEEATNTINQLPEDRLVMEADPFALEIEDKILARITDRRLKQSSTWYENEKKLTERRKKNEDYLFGRQINERDFKKYNARYIDNLIYEAEATIKPIALSRLPDLLVKQGTDKPESKQTAQELTEILNSDLRKRENRRALALAFKHIPVDFVGIIKARWDPEKGKNGDYVFEFVDPKTVVMDHTCTSNDPAEMDYIAQSVEKSVKEVCMLFPDKEEELYLRLNIAADDSFKEEKMASKITIWEVWFTWYEKKNGEYVRIEGVLWKFKDLILKKMKNPYWDWKGQTNYFTYDEMGNKSEVPTEDMQQAALLGVPIPGMDEEEIYHNYFEMPQKPYIVLGYDQWGTMPLDETSRIEQVIRLQENVNKRGKQITEIADRSKGKHVFSTASGLDKEDVENMDMGDPDQDVVVNGPVNQVHAYIPGEQPSQALFQDQDINRERIFQKMGVNSTTRGEVATDTATTAQIAREADYGRIDDLVEDTINYAAEKMANWAMQFIKVFYTEDHFKRVLGKNGEVTFLKISRDMIDDGMEVIVYASGVDKVMRKREAYELAKMKLIDPLSFYEKIDMPNPVDMTEKLMLFSTSPQEYMAKYVMGLENTGQMAAALNGQPAMPQQGSPLQSAQPPSPEQIQPPQVGASPIPQAPPQM